ncbi:hypothetical protein GLOIN_2v1844403 [Rhizophagus irregularis DAOM 181602=DAOM 197198]|uniref:Uncharacterized protein n=1 Tax=Rhizophagus irregularis (strain DAOM 181602 / DAOM 197198 / MUCL 43194) TaxID=747089 RepID=A0A2P4PKT3_RHIID|nr:hypothetical protein GLOIN_2v1844403 [Rhizophagus irregularis DAOM 181602=DAOM 197198]POG65985.1 hypothetical protein GLOIN_2v1844403 [Rhizophagus irregularis DAOM 181602=DAOM 197198]|eukprot:XP_025172851.1 hypothetical protein GLOIN_2v1844403 [Rhizophagus irregularis DAOM 181602=DAOM 197198]
MTKTSNTESRIKKSWVLAFESDFDYLYEIVTTARECQKILKQVAEERTKHEAENAELRSRIEELENGRMDTVAECEKADMSGEKSLEDKKTDASLDEVHKWVDTCEAKVDVIKANREFKSLYKDFMAKNNAVKKKAKGQVYYLRVKFYAEKKRWAGECFRSDLESDTRFYRGAMERKEDPRKYYTSFLTRDMLIGEELLRRMRRGILESR